ncbi:hypothetical protein [Acrocarpospora sp. B8E8]|uniref:hypothetical protein n=1 Tax=Acrocarpospora sp. B8E8 TaxID=3153572 RepID=UPI00325D520D
MPEIPEPEVRVFAYEVTAIPPDHELAKHFRLLVKRIGGDVWGVTENGFNYWYDADGEDGYYSDPSRRFDLETALGVARRLVSERFEGRREGR